MKRKLYVAVWGISLLTACSAPKTGAPEWFENAVKTSDHQLLYMAEQLKDVPDTACFPRSTKADGSYRLENAKDWTSGFYPGSMCREMRLWQKKPVGTPTVWKIFSIIQVTMTLVL